MSTRRDGRPQPTDPSDVASLTTRMTQGDESAWRVFHARYFDRLLRYLLVVARGREEDARDALQGAFLRAARHIRRFDDEEKLWSWLTVLARSALADHNRKHRRYRALLDRFFQHTPVASAPDPLMGSAEARLLALLEHQVAGLAENDRALIEHKYLAGAAVRELAQATGATEKSVESRLARIRRRLRDAILARLKHDDTD